MVLGFEETEFTVFEDVGLVELCVNITFPPIFEPGTNIRVQINDINIETESQDVTAGILLLDLNCLICGHTRVNTIYCIVTGEFYFLPIQLVVHHLHSHQKGTL